MRATSICFILSAIFAGVSSTEKSSRSVMCYCGGPGFRFDEENVFAAEQDFASLLMRLSLINGMYSASF
jgi:hypothetical protein